jgi:hypothetical protein
MESIAIMSYISANFIKNYQPAQEQMEPDSSQPDEEALAGSGQLDSSQPDEEALAGSGQLDSDQGEKMVGRVAQTPFEPATAGAQLQGQESHARSRRQATTGQHVDEGRRAPTGDVSPIMKERTDKNEMATVKLDGTAIESGATLSVFVGGKLFLKIEDGTEPLPGNAQRSGFNAGLTKHADGIFTFEIPKQDIQNIEIKVDNYRANDFSVSPAANVEKWGPNRFEATSVSDWDGKMNSLKPNVYNYYDKDKGELSMTVNMSEAQLGRYKEVINGSSVGNLASDSTKDPQNKNLEAKLVNGQASQAEINLFLTQVNEARKDRISAVKSTFTTVMGDLRGIEATGHETLFETDDPLQASRQFRNNVSTTFEKLEAVSASVEELYLAIDAAEKSGVNREELMRSLKDHPLVQKHNLQKSQSSENNAEPDGFGEVLTSAAKEKSAEIINSLIKQMEIMEHIEGKVLNKKEAKDLKEAVELGMNLFTGIANVGEAVLTLGITVGKQILTSQKRSIARQLARAGVNDLNEKTMPSVITHLNNLHKTNLDNLAAAEKKLAYNLQHDVKEALAPLPRTETNRVDKDLHMKTFNDITNSRNALRNNIRELQEKVDATTNVGLLLPKLAASKDSIAKELLYELNNALEKRILDPTQMWKAITSNNNRIFDENNFIIGNLDVALNLLKLATKTAQTGNISKEAQRGQGFAINTHTGPKLEHYSSNENGASAFNAIKNMPEYQKLMEIVKPWVLRSYAEQEWAEVEGTRYAQSPVRMDYNSYNNDGSNRNSPQREGIINYYYANGHSMNNQVYVEAPSDYEKKLLDNIEYAEKKNAELREAGIESMRYLVVDERFLRTSAGLDFGNRPTWETRVILVNNWSSGLDDPTVLIGNNPEVFKPEMAKRNENPRSYDGKFTWSQDLNRQYYRYPSTPPGKDMLLPR